MAASCTVQRHADNKHLHRLSEALTKPCSTVVAKKKTRSGKFEGGLPTLTVSELITTPFIHPTASSKASPVPFDVPRRIEATYDLDVNRSTGANLTPICCQHAKGPIVTTSQMNLETYAMN